jgi:hypothetical protein
MAGAAALAIAGSAFAAAAPGSRLSGLRVGGFGGYETNDVSGLSIRADGEVPVRDLTAQLRLSGVGSFGYSRLTESVRYGELTSHVLKLVPSARLSVAVTPVVSLFGDAGLGLALVSARRDTNVPFFGSSSASASSVNVMMRLGVGAWYHMNGRVDVGAMLELDPIFGDYAFSGARSQTTFLALVGVMYQL